MFKVIVIGDSLALSGHTNTYEDTWFYKIQEHFSQYHFIPLLRRGLTTKVLVTEGGGDPMQGAFPMGADCLEHYMPDTVIIQLGIVDCAPRLFGTHSLEAKLVNRMPSAFRSRYINLVKKFRKRSEDRVDVPLPQFKNNIEVFLKRCLLHNVKRVVFIKICTPDQRVLKKNPLMLANVLKYNDCIDQIVDAYSIACSINPLIPGQGEPEIYDDGYHPNPAGNRKVFDELVSCLGANE